MLHPSDYRTIAPLTVAIVARLAQKKKKKRRGRRRWMYHTCYGIASNDLEKSGNLPGCRYWDRLCITWEVFLRRETRGFRVSNESCPSLPSCPKGIKLLSSISTQPAQVTNNENLPINRPTWEEIPFTYPRNLTPEICSKKCQVSGGECYKSSLEGYFLLYNI